MKRLLAIAASAVVLFATACGNTRVLPLSELLSADREELTPEQWDMKKQLFGILVDKVEI